MCLNLSYIADYVKLEKPFGGIRVKNEKMELIDNKEFQTLYDKSKKLIDSARNNMGQMANTITVLTSFLLGRYIVEQEQQGAERAKYGAKIVDSLSVYLTEEYGRGFSRSNVAGMRQFYMCIKTGKMKLSSQELDNLDRHLKLSNQELDNWKWHITIYLLSSAGRDRKSVV